MWRGSLPSSAAIRRASSEGVTSASAMILPSAFDTIFWHTTSTPFASAIRCAAAARSISDARSSPGFTAGRPSIAMSSTRLTRPTLRAARACARRASADRGSRARPRRDRRRSRARAARARRAVRPPRRPPRGGASRCRGRSAPGSRRGAAQRRGVPPSRDGAGAAPRVGAATTSCATSPGSAAATSPARRAPVAGRRHGPSHPRSRVESGVGAQERPAFCSALRVRDVGVTTPRDVRDRAQTLIRRPSSRAKRLDVAARAREQARHFGRRAPSRERRPDHEALAIASAARDRPSGPRMVCRRRARAEHLDVAQLRRVACVEHVTVEQPP